MEWIKVNFTRLMALGLLVLSLVGVMALAFPTQVAQAAALDEPAPPPDGQALTPEMMEKALARAVKLHERQEKLFAGTDKLQTRLETLVEKAGEAGKDVSAVETALGNLETAKAAARSAYDNAGAILDTHAGFDADGKVVDEAAARTTLEGYRAASKEVRETLGGAMKELKEAFKAFREANPRPAETAEPAPIS
jgi:hypothetical protein